MNLLWSVGLRMRIGNILLEKIFFGTKRLFDLSEFVHFRKRLKEKGLWFILSQTVELHSEAKIGKEVQIDTTVMEKNITFSTDAKLAKKGIDNCMKIAEIEGAKQG